MTCRTARSISFAILLAGSLSLATAANPCPSWSFRERTYYDPLVAEPRAAMVNILFLGRSDPVPFVANPGSRRIWDISLGKEIPIYGCQTSDLENLPKGAFGWGIWIPISFHMIEDFKDFSNPILNTDYRFGGSFKAQYGLTKNWRLGGKFQLGHESTHLGDELSIAAERREPLRFERVNVSYEYWEYGLAIEGDHRGNRWKVRHGGIALLDNKKGFYSAQLLFPDERTITPSTRNFEPSFGAEWRREVKWKVIQGLFTSLDARLKTVYNYHKPSATSPDDWQPSFNLLAGFHRAGNVQERRTLRPHFYFRFYHGVNPAGQFRSQRDYKLLGVGLYIPF